MELTDDVQGLQIGGAIKNIIALAAGISDGLGNGINAKTALLAQGIKEMKQFASLYGGKAETMEGVAGLGDLLVTAMSPLSRNRQAGNYLAQGYNKEQIIHELMHMEVESFTVLKKIDLPPDAHQNFPIFSMVKYLYTNNPSR
ncbi:MAG: hypothetical protein LBH96_01765 [Candidatus Peribacteria bacterium]|nr:hypothetical protein [Candidatus Peribacteria bacterium]